MNPLVCIKQVPSSSVPMEDSGNLDRSRSGGQLNPRDLFALEAGLRIAQATGGRVTALTMGPESAEAVLKTAFSMGAARGILACDPAFRGADVYATAYTLAQAISLQKGVDLVICGQQTTDGDTAQLPFSLGAQLGIPAVGWIKAMEIRENSLLLLQELSGGTQEAELHCPCILAVGEGIGRPRIPSLRDQLKARSKAAERLCLADLPDPDPAHYGQAGSHTRVVGIRNVVRERKHPPIPADGEQGAQRILREIREVRGL